MTRSNLFVVVCLAAVVIVGSLCLAANSGGDNQPQSVENTLAVQKAMMLARDHLLRSESKQAVDLLEANLARINGDRKYLSLLRDAYRSYIKDLTLANQAAQADVYQKRLRILDDQEVAQQVLASAAQVPNTPAKAAMAKETVPAASAQAPAAKAQTPQTQTAPIVQSPLKDQAKGAVAKLDPFDAANEAKNFGLSATQEPDRAKGLLARAEEEFKQERYADAKRHYEQAYEADKAAFSNDCRGRWAYCQLRLVVDQLNAHPQQPCDWKKLEIAVNQAVIAAPHMASTADTVLAELNKRRSAEPPATAARATMAVPVKHQDRGDHGWKIAESTNFRVFHNQATQLAETVVQIAEQTRSQMCRKWFGKDDDDWTPKCDIYLHANTGDYGRHTGQQGASPGHSRIELDSGNGRVVVRQVHLRCDNQTMVECILPHETTHVVLAGHFGNHHVPRWLDEGIAVLSEPANKVEQHRSNLAKSLQNRELIRLEKLLELDAYPAPAQISTFYAQSVALVDYLTRQKGPVVLTQFVREALQGGYESALRKHYGFQSIGDLQNRFTENMLAEINGPQPSIAGRPQ